ncbi:matrixin family metalloprotease [Pyxidicoccus fallax]|uniref:Matrixin family metalloprotease n=1 Tax=Pyxidicoccus fallax TaxID=394095 RepID=A0A848LDK5_9BACT|nr:M57 family metalloprotease [Pyxidicoccus fallax]NMO16484.1 matrixin family metalloprotease [Pyxidicoccus fallax]NPC77454.1 matrixin family metalloprotease [Pyxidicoccus fallax]
MLKFRSMALLAGVSLLGTACGGSEAQSPKDTREMSFDEFRQLAYQEPETGVFIAFGDQAYESEALLRDAFEQAKSGVATTQDGLAVYSTRGKDIKWTASEALNLTYCVSTGFGGNYSKVVSAMNTAVSAWEGAARINFIHVTAQDPNCNARNGNVVFDVSPVNVGGQYLARAFFPNSSRRSRNVLIDNSSFSAGAPGLDGILRHELGHTLGFRHEHTRPEAGACFEDNNWRGLTPYDSSSVMHYPQCNGTNTWSLTLTTLDKQGAAILYP